MAFILASLLPASYHDEDGVKRAQRIPEGSDMLRDMKRYITRCKRVVYMVNYPYSPEENDASAAPVFEGLAMSGFDFAERIVLDARNLGDAHKIISGADLVILGGGKILCQLDYLREYNIRDTLSDFGGLVVGVSAGAMNLCKTVANFPEEPADLGQPLWVDGLGFFDGIIIPHFDGEACAYQLPFFELDVINDYVLPLSRGKTFIGIPNGSYILVDGDTVTYRGDMYHIIDGQTKKFN